MQPTLPTYSWGGVAERTVWRRLCSFLRGSELLVEVCMFAGTRRNCMFVNSQLELALGRNSCFFTGSYIILKRR